MLFHLTLTTCLVTDSDLSELCLKTVFVLCWALLTWVSFGANASFAIVVDQNMKENLSPVGCCVCLSQTPQHELGMRAAVHPTPCVNLPYLQPLSGFTWRTKKQISNLEVFRSSTEWQAYQRRCLRFCFPLQMHWVQEVITKFKSVMSGLNFSLKRFLKYAKM